MKVIVTGASGFIGSHLCEKLIKANYNVLGIDSLKSSKLDNLKNVRNHSNFSFIQADVRYFNEIEKYFEKVNYVFHLAALADIVPSIEKPREYYETNVTGTYNVLAASSSYNVKKVVYAASSSCYGIPSIYPTPEDFPTNPQYPYALTKLLGEQLVMHWGKIYKLPVISLRLFNVYGPRARTSGSYGAMFGVFLAQKLRKKPFTIVGDGNQTRDFIYVSDVVEAFYTAANSKITNEIMNVGSGNHHSVNEIVDILGGEKTYIPKRPKEPDCTFADIKKIQKLLNWSAKITLKDGINKLLTSIDDFKNAPVWDPKSIELATENWFKYLK
jgi:UDP-glucose 4-epimerase